VLDRVFKEMFIAACEVVSEAGQSRAAMDGMAAGDMRVSERPTLLAALDGVADAVIVVDQAWRVRLVNEAALSLLDLGPASRPGRLALTTLLRRSKSLDPEGCVQITGALDQAVALGTDVERNLPLRQDSRATVSVRRIAARRWRLIIRPLVAAVPSRRCRRDPLTGLADREALRTRLTASLERGAATLLLLDLDRFKTVNDTLGHPVGDQLLCAAAERMRHAVRRRDLVARLGGDEFAILLQEGADVGEGIALAERLLDLLARPYLLKGNLVSAGASIGIADASSDGDCDEMIRRADLALYQAKAEGRGAARVFDATMNDRAQARSALEGDLRRAIALRQFALHFQPQYDMSRRVLVGFEALLRWPHPERGMVSPGTFVPVAEEIGLIGTIGTWVLRRACAEAASWSYPLRVAVNVSPLQFERGDELVASVQAALLRSGLPADRLEVEITESALLSAETSTMATLHTLRALGVRISLDDFGTGYSSLSQLSSFPFDKIKIDRSFVNDVAHSQQASAIIRAISTLSDSLGMATIAEGVETEEQARAVARNGCGDIQGYLISRPVPAGDVEGLIGRYGVPTDERRADPRDTQPFRKESEPCLICIG